MRLLDHQTGLSGLWEQSLLYSEDVSGKRFPASASYLLKHVGIETDSFGVNTDLTCSGVDVIDRLNIFNDDVIAYLRGLSEFSYHHQDVAYHIRCFMQQEIQGDPDRFHCFDKCQLQTGLRDLVFTEDFAKLAVEYVSDNWIYSQNASYCAIFLLGNLVFPSQEGMLNYRTNYDLYELLKFCFKSKLSDIGELFDNDGPYKYNKTDEKGRLCVNTWFTHSFEVMSTNCNDKSRREIKIINVDKGSVPELEKEANEIFYFFGTAPEFVESIIKSGVAMTQYGDFTDIHHQGYYVLDNLDKAIDLANRYHRPAVMIFKVNQHFFESYDGYLRYGQNNEDRNRLHQIFRKFRKRKLFQDETLEISISESVAVTGPCLRLDSLVEDITKMELEPDVMQTCIYDRAVANELLRSIYGILYFPLCSKRNAERQR